MSPGDPNPRRIAAGLVALVCSACRANPTSHASDVSSAGTPRSTPSASVPQDRLATEHVAASGPQAEAVAAPVDPDAAVRALCAPADASRRTWHISTWQLGAGKIVALSFLPVGPSADPKAAKSQLCLVEAEGAKLGLVAQGPVLVGESECSNEPAAPSDPPSFELDLAPYVLAAGSTALGVRLNCQNTFGAGEGGQSRLYLFERQGERLAQVLDEEIAWFSHDRVASSHAEAKGVLVIQKKAHDDHFDLVIHMNVSREADGGRPSKQTETRKLVWQNDHYVRVGH